MKQSLIVMLLAVCGLSAMAQKRVINVYQNGKVTYSIPVGKVTKITVEESTDYPYLKQLCDVWSIETILINNGTENLLPFTGISTFRLTMNADHTYTIDNTLPFALEENGTWSVDDNINPTKIIFKEDGSLESAAVEIPYPNFNSVIPDDSRLKFNVSEGCESNTITYQFKNSAQ